MSGPEQLHGILEASPIGVWMSDRDGRIVWANTRISRMLGAPPDTIIGSSVTRFIDPTGDPGLANGTAQDGNAPRNQQVRIRRADGALFWARLSVEPLDHGKDGIQISWIQDVPQLTAAATGTQGTKEQQRSREVELERRSRLLDSVLDNIGHGLVVYDGEGRLVVHNRRFADMYGLEQKDLVPGVHRGEIAKEMIRKNWPDQDEAPEFFNASGVLNNPDGAERYQVHLTDGRTFERSVFELHDGGSVITHTDITVHKRRERDTLEKTRFLELTLEAIDQGIAVQDATHVVLANRRYAELLEIPVDILDDGLTLEQLHGYLDRLDAVTTSDTRNITSGSLQTNERRRADGTWLVSSLRAAADGLQVWTVSDITERKRAEADVQEQSEILQNVFDNVAQGLAAYDSEARVITWNKKYQEFLILADDQIYRGCPVWDLVMLHANRGTYGPGDRAAMEDRVQARIDQLMSGEEVHFDYVNAKGIQMEAVSAPRPQGGFVVTYADITDRKKAEAEIIKAKDEAETANQSKSDFLAAMSHEIRTPMNGVLGLIEVLENSELSEDQRTLTSTIHESAMTLLTIIDDILDFSKFEAGRLELEMVPVTLRRTVELVLDTVIQSAEAKGLDLTMILGEHLPVTVIGDPVRLRQILLNLLGNAVKFTEAGTVTVQVNGTVDPADASRMLVTFSVTDTGLGISEGNQAKLFQPFRQAESTTTRRFGGTGLGLSICRRLVDLMDGEIGVRSIEGDGSTFWFTIPVEVVAVDDSDDVTQPDLAGIPVILVCCRREIREAIERDLLAAGLTVTCTQSLDTVKAAFDAENKSGDDVPVLLVDDRIPSGAVTALLDHARTTSSPGADRTILIRGPTNTQLDGVLASAFQVIVNRPVRRAALLRAIGIVVGKISQETLAPAMAETGPRVRVQVPTVDEALGQGQLILVAEDNPTNRMLVKRQLTMLGFQAEYAEDGAIAHDLWRQKAYGLVLERFRD